MKYLVIMPAYDEEKFIGRTIESLIDQSLPPDKLIIVDDGSIDSTGSIVQSYCQKYRWIQLVRNALRSNRGVGAKVVEAFNLGFEDVDEEYDFIVKMDADLALPAEYFATIAKHFTKNPKLGIAGGTIVIEKNGHWINEYSADANHVKGACKSYRASCFKDIDGILRSIGWDTADELLARYHGWEILVDPELEIKHYRKMGSHTKIFKLQRMVGQGMYRLRYGFPITFTSAMKAGLMRRPYGLTSIFLLLGWIQSWLKRDSFLVGTDEGRFIRRYRLKMILNKIKAFVTYDNL